MTPTDKISIVILSFALLIIVGYLYFTVLFHPKTDTLITRIYLHLKGIPQKQYKIVYSTKQLGGAYIKRYQAFERTWFKWKACRDSNGLSVVGASRKHVEREVRLLIEDNKKRKKSVEKGVDGGLSPKTSHKPKWTIQNSYKYPN